MCEGDPNLFFVCVDLISGELGRDVTVTVQTEDDSAHCTYSIKYLTLVSVIDKYNKDSNQSC